LSPLKLPAEFAKLCSGICSCIKHTKQRKQKQKQKTETETVKQRHVLNKTETNPNNKQQKTGRKERKQKKTNLNSGTKKRFFTLQTGHLMLAWMLVAFLAPLLVAGWDNGVARTPPMGYSNWNMFHNNIVSGLVMMLS
jgi:Flp pilus assembly protein TadB